MALRSCDLKKQTLKETSRAAKGTPFQPSPNKQLPQKNTRAPPLGATGTGGASPGVKDPPELGSATPWPVGASGRARFFEAAQVLGSGWSSARGPSAGTFCSDDAVIHASFSTTLGGPLREREREREREIKDTARGGRGEVPSNATVAEPAAHLSVVVVPRCLPGRVATRIVTQSRVQLCHAIAGP